MPEERREDQQDEQGARNPDEAQHADPKVEDLDVSEDQGNNVKGGVVVSKATEW